jgi:K+-transporting ATPase ATPase C chain
MKSALMQAIRLTGVCLVMIAGVYTLLVWGIAQTTPNRGKGTEITANGKTYKRNIGQAFTADKYFWSRPSAAGYNASASAGSNKGPTNPEYLAQVQDRIDTFLVHNPGVKKAEIPVDLITASASGLDPHISVQAASVQLKRISLARHLNEDLLRKLIAENTEKPALGVFGPEKINVLKINIELDKLDPKTK